ncbi:hypothetical protein GCM10027416_30520 [Okibacterium endophyticum]
MARRRRSSETWWPTCTRPQAPTLAILASRRSSPISVTLDCDILTTHDVDFRLVVYTAPPGSEDAEKLDLLRVVGVQGSWEGEDADSGRASCRLRDALCPRISVWNRAPGRDQRQHLLTFGEFKYRESHMRSGVEELPGADESEPTHPLFGSSI